MSRNHLYLPALTALAVAVPAQSAVAAPGPVLNWQFDKSSDTIARDSSTSNNHGAIMGATRIPGRFGNGLGFDGAGSKVLVPRNASLEPGRITVEAWVRSAGTPGKFRYILAKGATECNTGSYGLYTGIDGGLQFYVSTGATFSFVTSPDAGPGVWDGNWHHVAGTYDGTAVRTFVDGVEVGSGTPASLDIGYGLGNNDAYVGIFNDACAESLGYKGDIDEARIWPRALSGSELAASHALGAPGTRRLTQTDFSDESVVHTARTGPGPTLSVSIVSGTGQRRIRDVRIGGILPLGSLATCSSGLLSLQDPTCDIKLSNDGKTATLKLTRVLKPIIASTVNLRITLSNGRAVTAVSEID